MIRCIGSRGLSRVTSVVFVATLFGVTACGTRSGDDPERLVASSTLSPSGTGRGEASSKLPPSSPARGEAAAPVAEVKDGCPILVSTESKPEKAAPVRSATALRPGEAGLAVKRLVVTTGVSQREPLATEGELPADGTPIYAFAELSNTSDREQEIRVTFERQGSGERVGNVTLTIPANSSRYRTWAKTRYVLSSGTWVAVIVNENGTELGRSTFDALAGAPAS